MSEPILCLCGAVLVEDVSREGVTPIGGEPIRFRRDTDYVVCPACHRVYKARTLLSGAPLTDSLARKGEAGADDDAIERLERIAESEGPEP